MFPAGTTFFELFAGRGGDVERSARNSFMSKESGLAAQMVAGSICGFSIGQVTAAAIVNGFNEHAPKVSRAVSSAFPAWTESIVPEYMRALVFILAFGIADCILTALFINNWSAVARVVWGSIHILVGLPCLLLVGSRVELVPFEIDGLVYLAGWVSAVWLVHFVRCARRDLPAKRAA